MERSIEGGAGVGGGKTLDELYQDCEQLVETLSQVNKRCILHCSSYGHVIANYKDYICQAYERIRQ